MKYKIDFRTYSEALKRNQLLARVYELSKIIILTV